MSPRTTKQFEEIRKSSKENILNAALKLFSANGYAETSIRKIAREAKVSDGLFYNYFKSKEELALGVLKGAFTSIDEVIADNDSKDPSENIRASITSFIDLLDKEREKIRLLAQMGLHKQKIELINKITVAKYEQSVARFEKSFQRLGVKNSLTEAQFLVAILDGLVFETLLMDNAVDLEEMKNNLIQKYSSL